MNDFLDMPSRLKSILFWLGIAFMCACTFIVVCGGIGYLAGIFN